jgi:hypothetical protein
VEKIQKKYLGALENMKNNYGDRLEYLEQLWYSTL